MQSTKSIKFCISVLMLTRDFPGAFYILIFNFCKQWLCSNMLPNTLVILSLKLLSSCDPILHSNEALPEGYRLLITGNLYPISFKHLAPGTTIPCPPNILAATMIPLSDSQHSASLPLFGLESHIPTGSSFLSGCFISGFPSLF